LKKIFLLFLIFLGRIIEHFGDGIPGGGGGTSNFFLFPLFFFSFPPPPSPPPPPRGWGA
jgi:hypothetical protein